MRKFLPGIIIFTCLISLLVPGCIPASSTQVLTPAGEKPSPTVNPPPSPAATTGEVGPFSGASLYKNVVKYWEFGEHRTATETDKRTSEWLFKELTGYGLKPEYFQYNLKQFLLKEASLEIDGKKIESFPLWPPRPTGVKPVEAKIVRYRSEADLPALKDNVILLPVPGSRPSLELLIKSGAAGVIAVTGGPEGLPVAVNVSGENTPEAYSLPVLLVGLQADGVVDSWEGKPVKMSVEGNWEMNATSSCVTARLNRGQKLIVVSTPSSGWFGCAGERGPGISLALALAEWANRNLTDTSFLFTFNSGHELDHLGMQKLLAVGAPKPEEVTAWLHLGANIATCDWALRGGKLERIVQYGSGSSMNYTTNLEAYVKPAFSGLKGYRLYSNRVIGEVRNLVPLGYPIFNLVGGGNIFFHTKEDRPETTDPTLLEPVARALATSFQAIISAQK